MKLTFKDAIGRMPQYLYDKLLEQYDRNIVDSIIRGYAIDKTIKTNANKVASYSLDANTPILDLINNSEENKIPRQTIYRFYP